MSATTKILALIFPIFSLIGLGYFGKKRGLLKDDAADSLSAYVFYFAFPALLFSITAKTPVGEYTDRNLIIAYNWKTKFNETGKIPAFYNIFPELNHDEMNGFDVRSSTSGLMQNFHFLFLRDGEDSPRIIKRMEVLEKLLLQRQLPVEIIDMKGSSVLYKIFSVLILADWTTYYTAEGYGVEPEQVPMVEEFKRLIK